MRAQLQHLSEFMKGMRFLDDPALTPILPTPFLHSFGLSTGDRGYVWVTNPVGDITGTPITVAGLTPASYRVAWYDTWTDGAAVMQLDVSCDEPRGRRGRVGPQHPQEPVVAPVRAASRRRG